MEFGLITTKKVKQEFDNRFTELETSISKINNFNAVYKELIATLDKSKELVEKQDLEFQKKIMENNSTVDTRLSSFNDRINKVIEDSINNANNLLEEQKKITKEYSNTVDNKLVEYDTKVVADLAMIESALKEINSLNDRFNTELDSLKEEVINKGNLRFEESIGKIENEWIEQKRNLEIEQNRIISEKITEFANQFNEMTNRLQINLMDIIISSIKNELMNVEVEKVVDKATNKILEAFNESLKEFEEPAKESVIDSIRALVAKDLKIKDDVKSISIIKPLPENAVFHRDYQKLKACINAGVVPMLVGPAGTGKSTAVEQLASDLNLPSYMANRIQNTFELVGFVDASGQYVTTQFYEAFTKGGLFLFDEVDASSPEALVTINAALAQGYMAFPGHPTAIEMHPNFKVVCAGNTIGTGSTLQYTGRNKLDAATLDRFMIIDWDYDEEMEDKLVDDKELLKICWEIRKQTKELNYPIILSTRGIITLDKILRENEKTNVFLIKDIFRQKLFKSMEKKSINHLVEALKINQHENIYFKYLDEMANKDF